MVQTTGQQREKRWKVSKGAHGGKFQWRHGVVQNSGMQYTQVDHKLDTLKQKKH